MTKRVHLFIAVALVLLALSALGVGLFLITPRVSMRIEAYGTQGQTINATFEVDGVPSKEVRDLPAEFEFKAKTLSYSIERSSGDKMDQITVDVYVDGKKRTSASGSSTVRGEHRYGAIMKKNSISSQ
jgi:hypothetical protein